MSKFALFVDLENCGAKVATLNSILEKVKIRGDILLGKVYGYTDRFSDLKEVLLSNTFTVTPSLRYGIATVLALCFYYLLPFDPEARQALVLLAYSPIGSAVPAFTAQIKGDTGLSSAINSISIILSIIIVVALLSVML